MKVLYCCHADNYHIQKWAPLISELGIEVHIATFRPAKFSDASITVHTLETRGTRLSYSDFFSARTQLNDLLRIVSPNLLFCSFATTYGLLGTLTGFRPRVIQTWSRDIAAPGSLNRWEKVLVKTVGRWVLSKSDGITTDGHSFKKHLLATYPSFEPKTLATPWGINTEEYTFTATEKREAKERLFGDRSRIVLTSVRGVYWYYQPERIVPALVQLANKQENITIPILTLNQERTPEVQRLLDTAAKHPRVQVIDRFLDKAEILDVWAASDFFLSAPKFDGVSESVQEGRAAGAIPILNPLPSNLEMTEGEKHAFFIETDTEPEQLAERLGTIIETPEVRLEQMRAANRAWIDKHGNNARTADNLVRFLKSIAES